jgi:hypothetical protein
MCTAAISDDPTIPDESFVYRRIFPGEHEFDSAVGRVRPNSNNFADHPENGPVSVDLGCEMEERGEEGTAALRGHEGYLLVKISVRAIRELGLGVARTPDDDNPCHGEIRGRKTQSTRRKLARQARWVVPPGQSRPDRAP